MSCAVLAEQVEQWGASVDSDHDGPALWNGVVVTLLVGFASPEFAILASDRMITWTQTQRIKGKDQTRLKYTEGTTKATYFRGQYLIAYSGVADLGNDTEQWLVEHLAPIAAGTSLAQWRERLVADLAVELKRLGRPAAQSWLSLMVVGYRRQLSSGDFHGHIQTITNDREPLRLYGGRAREEYWRFTAGYPSVEVPNGEFQLWAVGSVPSPQKMRDAAADIRAYRKRYLDRSRGIVRVLAQLIVQRSIDLDGRGVGRAVQVTVMPRSAIGKESVSMGVFNEPLTGVSSLEFNPRLSSGDGWPIFTGINLVTSSGTTTGLAVAFGATEMIGPQEAFRSPEFD